MQVLSSPKSKKDDLFCHLGAKGVGLGDGLAALEGTHEGDGICMPKASAGGHPLGQAGDAAICLGKELGQVEGGSLTLHIASDGENKLAAGVGCHARPEGLEGEVLGHDAIERGDFATQAVVETAEGAAALNGEHICGLLDDADLGSIAGGVAAGDAELTAHRKETALGASADGVGSMQEGSGEVAGLVASLLQEPEGQALCAAGARAGHALELGNQLLHSRWVILRFHDLTKRQTMAGNRAASTQSSSTQKRGAAT